MQYEVQYSEEDLFHMEGDYGRMHGNIVPQPEVGHYLVKRDGVYDITQVTFSMDNVWDVYLRPLVVQTQDGDIIVVQNKDRYYRFYNRPEGCGFRKITVMMLMTLIQQLEERLQKLQQHVDHVITVSDP